MNQDPVIFDVDFALRQFSGNESLLVKMLGKFTEQYSSIEQSLVSDIRLQNFDAVGQQVHTIKGVSGNLGMTALHQASRDFEAHIKSEAPDSVDCTSYVAVLKQTLTAIDQYANASAESNNASANDATGAGNPQGKQELLTALKRNEFITPSKLDQYIRDCALDSAGQTALRSAIDDLDYSAAIALLE
ncbi:Hpt domain-containing protein [Paraglaciecola polaris]|uniref:Hpt protein n=1 Tax=Paraglaciecola polaris LMG 21857 TaxID=1129793 RepID=K6YLU0_9ALTE|nr:Hpt domain-containing protein [Paraglaciecola polaris]GAC33674.1 hpt protein [Paraglaciecola polaris LMG 21857]|tara:strand:- start:7923 stop:8486 length:564 start_codon:yes stop_codon:yes gene_type:complete